MYLEESLSAFWENRIWWSKARSCLLKKNNIYLATSILYIFFLFLLDYIIPWSVGHSMKASSLRWTHFKKILCLVHYWGSNNWRSMLVKVYCFNANELKGNSYAVVLPLQVIIENFLYKILAWRKRMKSSINKAMN